MTSLLRPPVRRNQSTASARFRARAAWWRHPEVPLVALTTLAWIGLAVDHFANHDGAAAPADFHLVRWTAMVLAMMLPGVVPMVRYVAFNSLWSRRHRSASLFATAYVAVWVALGGAAWTLGKLGEQMVGVAPPRTATLVATATVAVGWQVTSTKYRALRRCHLRMPLAARGMAADRSAIHYGMVHARACVGSCWAIMATMLFTHDFHLMVPLAVVTIAERYQKRPTGVPGAAAIAIAIVMSVA